MFEYLSLLVRYNAENGTYRLIDLDYQVDLGVVSLYDGPGWVFEPFPTTAFLDSSQARILSEFLSDLNSDL